MNRVISIAMLLLAAIAAIAACGNDAISPPVPPPPPPPVIVKLVMASDTGFWRGGALRLSSLVRGAITDHGDTVAAPAVTWSLAAGFTRQGDSVFATKEARGGLRATFASAADSTVTTSLTDLSAKTWLVRWTCYNSAVVHRGVEEPPIGQDSIIRERFNGALVYTSGEWKNRPATITVDFRTVRFWKDGVIDTVLGTTTMQLQQDTANAKITISSVENLKMESDAPRIYRSIWVPSRTTWCDPSYISGGSDFVLREP